MNKVTIYVFLILVWVGGLTSCKQSEVTDRIISMTIEPQEYFASKIGGDHFEYNVMVPGGQSPETYDPTPQDIIKASKSMAYFRIGPINFETIWMDAIQANQPQMQVFDLSENISFIKEEEHAHTHDHDQAHHHEHDHEAEEGHAHHHHPGGIDPHIWSSFEGARAISQNLLQAFIKLDVENKSFYEENYQQVLKEIDETEVEVKRLLENSSTRAFVIYHPSLSYLSQELGLEQLTIESDGKEPSPLQLKELINRAKEKQVKVVFIQQEFDRKNAEIIAAELNCPLVQINPLSHDWKEEILHTVKALAAHE